MPVRGTSVYPKTDSLMHLGLERCVRAPLPFLRGMRFGLLVNQASLDCSYHSSCDLLDAAYPGQLRALFSPQHGLWSEEQDNMIESPHARHPRLGIPVHSLYAESRRPLPEMLEGLDCLVVDMQDVGTRVYTYVWTAMYCLEACAQQDLPMLILDRPNPLGGEIVEGPLLKPAYTSFVGRASVPMRHGLTMAELLSFINVTAGINAAVEVVPVSSLKRAMRHESTGRSWVPPSPNLPRIEGVQVYPGTVLVEGTNLSEGRGTTTPFEIVGAPFVDPFALAEAMRDWGLPGVFFRPIRFRPTFQKWQDRECGGVFMHVTDPDGFRPYATAVALLSAVRCLWPEGFRWLDPPYEYEETKMPIDILSGDCALRHAVAGVPLDAAAFRALTTIDAAAWWRQVAPFRLYD